MEGVLTQFDGPGAAGGLSADGARSFEAEALPHMRALLATAMRLTRNASDAEDVVQETYLRAFRAFHTFSPGTNLRAWLFRILQRAHVDTLRTAMRSVKTAPLDENVVETAPVAPAALPSDVECALRRVPEPFRTALILRDVEDRSYTEIGTILGVPTGTVMSRIHRGRAHLRTAFTSAPPNALAEWRGVRGSAEAPPTF